MGIRLIRLLLILIATQIAIAPVANAEEIPVLVWERGQVQNVVLGQGDQNQSWDVYLKDVNGKNFKFSKSAENSDNFLVYSINLPSNFQIGGYVVEARNQSGENKQVAGIQIISPEYKEITRVPLELILVLFGFSLFMYLLIQISGRNIWVKYREITNEDSFRNPISEKLKRYIERDERQSLVRTLTLELIDQDQLLTRASIMFGLMGICILSALQFFTSFWPSGNAWLIIVCILLGNISFSFGLLFAGLSIAFLLLNIATAKSVSEILAIFIISSLFVAPALYQQFLTKIFRDTPRNLKFNKYLVDGFCAALGALTAYQLLIVYESLSTTFSKLTSVKELMALIIGIVLFAKSYYLESRSLEVSEFKVVRAIGPLWTFAISVISGVITYVWTTNLLVSGISGLSIFFILACSWLKITAPKKLRLAPVGINFGFALILVVMTAIYFATRVLPLDVINSSHLMILLIFPFDLVLSLYLLMSKSENHEKVEETEQVSS